MCEHCKKLFKIPDDTPDMSPRDIAKLVSQEEKVESRKRFVKVFTGIGGIIGGVSASRSSPGDANNAIIGLIGGVFFGWLIGECVYALILTASEIVRAVINLFKK